MSIIIATISILVITGFVWSMKRLLRLRVCPICAGVSLTWLWMLAGVLTNQLPITNYQLPIAILMGGSVVGIAYQLEKRLPMGRSALFWKTLFIPAGFVAVYSLLAFSWIIFGAMVVILIFLALIFLRRISLHPQEENSKIKELEKKMEKCC